MVVTFRALIETWREAQRKAGTKPPTFRAVAKRCGLSQSRLYTLMAGEGNAPEWTVENIAAALDCTNEAVEGALAMAQKQAAT